MSDPVLRARSICARLDPPLRHLLARVFRISNIVIGEVMKEFPERRPVSVGRCSLHHVRVLHKGLGPLSLVPNVVLYFRMTDARLPGEDAPKLIRSELLKFTRASRIDPGAADRRRYRRSGSDKSPPGEARRAVCWARSPNNGCGGARREEIRHRTAGKSNPRSRRAWVPGRCPRGHPPGGKGVVTSRGPAATPPPTRARAAPGICRCVR